MFRPPKPRCSRSLESGPESTWIGRQPQDDVAIALARPAHGGETIDEAGFEPNIALAVRAKLALESRASERERADDRLEGGGRDGDTDHPRYLGAPSAEASPERLRPQFMLALFAFAALDFPM
jgi:hypothetical protein